MNCIQVFDSETNVLEAARRRVSFIFDNFEDIHVSVSGGKDSTVLAHLMIQEAERRGRKVSLFFLDEEVMYQSSIDQVTWLMEDLSDAVIPLWLQVEFNLTNAISYDQSHLLAWQAGKHKLWMRSKKPYAIKFPNWKKEEEIILNKRAGLDFYAVIENFERCYSNTAFVVGLRGTESPNRWRTVSKHPVDINGTPTYWATKKPNSNVALYPLYDWNFHDVWKYIYDNGLRYNRIYDYQFVKGYPINEMRVSSLIHEKSFKSLVDLPEMEPKTYNKLLKRVKGTAFAQETGKNSKVFKVRKLPKNFKTWRGYRDFLLDTYPDPSTREMFRARFAKHLDNEYVARQQCRQLVLNDIENNLPINNDVDPREKTIQYYMEVL